MGHRTKKTASGITYTVSKSKKSKGSKKKPTYKFIVVDYATGTIIDRKHKSEKGAHKFALQNETINSTYAVMKVPYGTKIAGKYRKDDIVSITKKHAKIPMSIEGWDKLYKEKGFNRGVELVFPNAPMPKGTFTSIEKNPFFIDTRTKEMKDFGVNVYRIKEKGFNLSFYDSKGKKNKGSGKITKLGNVS